MSTLNTEQVCEVVGINKLELNKIANKLKLSKPKKGNERVYTLGEVERIIKAVRKAEGRTIKTRSGNFQELVKYYD